MALMFPRVARNFAKNGYYPTDEATLERVLRFLQSSEAPMRILDPCAGEGVALAECKHHLGAELTTAMAVEYNEERAWHAKSMLDQALHADLADCVIEKRQFGLMWLNPPYGDGVADKAMVGSGPNAHGQRLEKQFYQRCNPLLQFGGVMVLIVPGNVLDAELCGWIGSHFEDVSVFKAVDRTYRQLVIFGVRKRASSRGRKAVVDLLTRAREGDVSDLPSLAESVPMTYVVPALRKVDMKFFTAHLDPAQLAECIGPSTGLWGQFSTHFETTGRPKRRPLMPLSNWHLALALAAGEISGVVRSDSGKVFVVKGATHKDKSELVVNETNDKGDVRETRIRTDKFVPIIRAIDFTPGSPSYGAVHTIR